MPTFEYPLALPTVSGQTVSVDAMLQTADQDHPLPQRSRTARVTGRTRCSPAGGSVSGGAVVYDQLVTNELFVAPGRDVMNVEPGAEFPIVTFDRPVPLVKPVEKFGGKFFVTDEARDRNDPQMLQQGTQRLANTINRRIHDNAVAELDAQITALGGSAQTATANNWGTTVTGGSARRPTQVLGLQRISPRCSCWRTRRNWVWCSTPGSSIRSMPTISTSSTVRTPTRCWPITASGSSPPTASPPARRT